MNESLFDARSYMLHRTQKFVDDLKNLRPLSPGAPYEPSALKMIRAESES